MEQDTMTFPEEEHSSIIDRLNQEKPCCTTYELIFFELSKK